MRANTLRKIMSALVDDFGYQAVLTSLEESIGVTGSVGTLSKRPSTDGGSRRARPNALTVVERLGIDDQERREMLMVLAGEFEDKEFMPNTKSVRAFLAQQGKDVSKVKSRQQAVASVFRCLADWETPKLRELHSRGLFGGPKSLASIARSIESVGERSRP